MNELNHQEANQLYKEIDRLTADLSAKDVLINQQAQAMERMDKTIKKLNKRLDAKDEELKQAVEDMTELANIIRESEDDTGCCFACKYDADFSITDSGCYANECPGFDKNDCFEWRGRKDG